MNTKEQEFVKKIAGFRTDEEILVDADTDDEEHNRYEEIMTTSAEILNELIKEARAILMIT